MSVPRVCSVSESCSVTSPNDDSDANYQSQCVPAHWPLGQAANLPRTRSGRMPSRMPSSLTAGAGTKFASKSGVCAANLWRFGRPGGGEIRPDLRCNLPIGHLVHRLDRSNLYPELALHQPPLQFALGLPRTKNNEGVHIAQRRDHRVVVDIERPCEGPLTTIVRRDLGGFEATLQR